MRFTPYAALLSAVLLAPAGVAQNLLVNGDFEAGLSGWSTFGNASAETANPPAVEPLSGTQLCKMFGNFSGGFDVSGIFQGFPATPGQSFTIDAWSRHWDGDPLIGGGPPNDNWVVMKIAFFDGGNVEIGGAEGTILDGNSPTNTWIDNASVTGIAPAGTMSVQALILYLQPNNDGGAAQIEDVSFTTTTPPSSGGGGNLLANGDFEAGLSGWGAFGNASAESANPPAVEPLSGTQLCKMFGNFSGGFDVTGIFQSFPAVPGQSFTIDAWSRHWDGDPLIGAGPPNDNWVVMKIAFFDGGGVEIGAAERTILDGSSPTNTWIDNAPVSGTAPAGTESVQALILFLQPANDGGSAQIEDVVFTTTAPCELAVNGDFETGDFTGWSLFPSTPGNITIASPGSSSMFAGRINNATQASASLIKNANIGLGTVLPGESITITFEAKGATAVGGVVFAELFSEIGGGGVSQSEILGGGPLALDPDPTKWTSFAFTTTTGPDVSGGVTLQLAAITGAAPGSISDACFDNVSVTIVRSAATRTNYGAGWPGTNGIPTLELDANPVLGQTVNVLMGNVSGTTAAACLLFGDQQTTTSTPFGGTLLANAVVVQSIPALAPTGGSFALTVPNLSILCGVEIYSQLIHGDTGASAGIAFSPGPAHRLRRVAARPLATSDFSYCRF